MSDQKKHDPKASQEHSGHEHSKAESPQKEHVGEQDPHHLKEPMKHALTSQNQPLDSGTAARNVGHNEGTGRPPMMKK